MSDFQYAYVGAREKIFSSQDEIGRLEPHLKALKVKRAMVVCGPNILRTANVVPRVEHALGGRLVCRFSGVEPHSPVAVLRAAVEMARKARPDTIVSVGGGTTLAIAKGIALLQGSDRDIKDYAARFEGHGVVLPPLAKIPRIKTRVIAIPTTMGGAELGTAVGGFTDETHSHKIIVGGNDTTGVDLIIVDGLALQTTPSAILAGTTMGQLRVAVESFASTAHNPVSDAMALHSIRMIRAAVENGWTDDLDQLLRIKAACLLASLATSALGSGVGKMGVNSAMARQLGTICRVEHGEANAILLPHTIVFNAGALKRRLFSISEALQIDAIDGDFDEIARKVAGKVENFAKQLGLPTRLRDVGVTKEAFGRIATAAFRDSTLKTNPRPIASEDEIMGLLRDAW